MTDLILEDDVPWHLPNSPNSKTIFCGRFKSGPVRKVLTTHDQGEQSTRGIDGISHESMSHRERDRVLYTTPMGMSQFGLDTSKRDTGFQGNALPQSTLFAECAAGQNRDKGIYMRSSQFIKRRRKTHAKEKRDKRGRARRFRARNDVHSGEELSRKEGGETSEQNVTMARNGVMWTR
ncbi:hypothetical protein EDD15DRAFT_2194457 [Pisolithus albus]|nr:hypothetical protein EDD15DRAFT_2194457 [Pisolithus albus]